MNQASLAAQTPSPFRTRSLTLTRVVPTPLGALHLVSDGECLTGAFFEGQQYFPTGAAEWTAVRDHALLESAARQVEDYFSGTIKAFELPLAASGTEFQQKVWEALVAIPHGTVTSYGDVARALGFPQASRAVGAAIGRNPLSLVVPCHRVIGANGSLTGYAGGIDRKRRLLELEGFLTAPLLQVLTREGRYPLTRFQPSLEKDS